MLVFLALLRRKNNNLKLFQIILSLVYLFQFVSATTGTQYSSQRVPLLDSSIPIRVNNGSERLGLEKTWIERPFHFLLNNTFQRSSTEDHGQLGAYCTSISHCVYGLVCLNQTCSYCTTSSQCQDIQLLCDSTTHQCTHKPITDFTWRDGLTFVLVFIIAGLSNAGGVGGGFLFVPVLVLATGYRASTAAAISQALVAGASGANTFYGLIRRHPKRERPRIDYGVVIHFIPSVLCGTSIGVLLNELFPNFFTLFALSALVLYVFYVSLKKGIRLWKQEKKEAENAKKEREAAQTEQNNLNSNEKELQGEQCNGSCNHQVMEHPDIMSNENGTNQEVVDQQADTNISLDTVSKSSAETKDNAEISSIVDDQVNGDITANHSETVHDEEMKTISDKSPESLDEQEVAINIGEEHNNETFTQHSWKERMLTKWSQWEKAILSVLDRIPLVGKFIDPPRHLKSSEDIIEYEKKQYPLDSIIFVIVIFAFLVVFSLLRGGHSAHSLAGVGLCSAGYTVLYVFQEVGLVLFTLLAGIRNVRMQTLKERTGYPFYAKDFHWTKLRVVYFSPLMIILGAIGAWVGAGGSFMSTPILVAGIGMDPVVVQSTAGFMNFTSGLSSALQYIFDHQMKIDYGLSLGAATLVGSFTGLYILNGLVARYNLQAILVIVMSIVMFGAFVVDLYAGVRELISVLDLNEHFPIRNICAAS